MNRPQQGEDERTPRTRRDVIRLGAAGLAAAAVAALTGKTAWTGERRTHVWQLDPSACVQCGRCETECVLTPSAVKAVHAYDLCGYCKLCGGYHDPQAGNIDTAAENQLCPTGAIRRTFVEDPFYEYTIIEDRCIGCGVCVKGCALFGNGSLCLQVLHDRCVNCNECAIARACPADAFRRVPVDQPYLLKG